MYDELKGEGNSLNYTFRMHDPRVGRFFATDPLAPKYPHNSPYAFSENRVLDAVELEGLEATMPWPVWETFKPIFEIEIGPMPTPPAFPLPPVIIEPGMPLSPVHPSIPSLYYEGEIDWNNPPAGPGELSEDWEDITSPDVKNSKYEGQLFRHKKTGERIRWDEKLKKILAIGIVKIQIGIRRDIKINILISLVSLLIRAPYHHIFIHQMLHKLI